MKRVQYENVVNQIRERGPLTAGQVADQLGISHTTAHGKINAARRLDLLKKVGKGDRGQFVFGAVQTSDWPAREVRS